MKARFPEWTPPIFGWQYELEIDHGHNRASSIWQGDRELGYDLMISGQGYADGRRHWDLFITFSHPKYRIQFHSRKPRLSAAIRDLEKQVATLERGVLRLHRDWAR